MFELSVLSRLPAEVAEALGQDHIARGKQLLAHARRARQVQQERQRLRGRRLAWQQVWRIVEGLRLSGLALDAAIEDAGRLLDLPAEGVRQAHAAAEARRGPHLRARRNLEIARRAAAGHSHAAIARAVGLRHKKSVSRIVAQLLRHRAFDRPGKATSYVDPALVLARAAPPGEPTP